MALGAQAREIRRLFVLRGVLPAAAGIAIGLGAAAAVTGLMRPLLFGIAAMDPLTFAAVSGILAATTALASYLPARRAAAVEAVEILTIS